MNSQEGALRSYSNSIKRLKTQCREAGISEEEFRNVYMESLQELEAENNYCTSNTRLRFLNKYRVIMILIVILTLFYYKYLYSTVLSNIQEYIYPGLRLLRQLSIPIISLFPSLTEYYDETCLVHNPYFAVADLDCWPCSTVTNVREMINPKPTSDQNGAPFIYETDQEIIDIEVLESLYRKNKNVFDSNAYKISIDGKYDSTPSEMFDILKKNKYSNEGHLFIWKFNSMNPARIIRNLIPRPKVVPKYGQSPERFLLIDRSQKLLKLPDTECNFSFLLSLKGNRKINLHPAEECKHQCKSLNVVLKESYLLWYNWWYWRPSVEPSSMNDTFIAHVGSYC